MPNCERCGAAITAANRSKINMFLSLEYFPGKVVNQPYTLCSVCVDALRAWLENEKGEKIENCTR